MSDPNEEERNAILFLEEAVGSSIDQRNALSVLRRNKLDISKSLDDLLSDTNNDEPPPLENVPPNPVIDLTADDSDQLKQAMKMSLEDVTTFGPSTREPDPSWQLVPTSTPKPASQDEESLRNAIQASLEDMNVDIHVQNTVREAGHPIPLLTEDPAYHHATMLINALFHIPQVQERFSKVPDTEDPFIHYLLEIFTNLDLARLSILDDGGTISRYAAKWDQASGLSLCDASTNFLVKVMNAMEKYLSRYEDDLQAPLFEYSVASTSQLQRRNFAVTPGNLVTLDTDPIPDCPNDLVSRLGALLKDSPMGSDVITQPSDVVAFLLKPGQASWGKNKADVQFVYPKEIYMDRYLAANYETIKTTTAREDVIRKELADLEGKRTSLTTFEDKNVVKNLENTVHYYENLANPNPRGNDPARVAQLGKIAEKLNRVLKSIKEALSAVDNKLNQLKVELDALFDDEHLKQHKYELRGALVSTGIKGRKSLYSYTQDVATPGVWWKIIDTSVSAASEEQVLHDPTQSLLSGAGPYLLFYSRSLEDSPRSRNKWPPGLVDAVHRNNETFLSGLPQQQVAANMDTDSATDTPPPLIPPDGEDVQMGI